MPSEHDLRGTGWTASDFGGAPTADEVTVPCDGCDTTTTADCMDGWSVDVNTETFETTTLCPNCVGGGE
mgnify:CR=1 FL=1